MARRCVIGVALTVACQTALAQAMYRIKPIGILPGGCISVEPIAVAFNGADQVTGVAANAACDARAFLWTNDGTPMRDLGPHQVGASSDTVDINSQGLVTGSAQVTSGEFAFLTTGNGTPMTKIPNGLGGDTVLPSAMNDLGQVTGTAATADSAHAFLWANDGLPMRDLGSLGGASFGVDINASGQVTGDSFIPGSSATLHAFIWKNDGTRMIDLGTFGGSYSFPIAINASGQVAGDSAPRGDHIEHAFLWKNDGSPMQNLGTLGGGSSFAVALNDSGQVAGYSFTQKGSVQVTHAFVWMNDGTPMKDLGAIGGTQSKAYDINSAGQVTGAADEFCAGECFRHAFLWRNDGTKTQDLNKLIDPTDPLKPYVTLTVGNFINDSGDIEATGIDSRTALYGEYLLQGTLLTLSPRSLAFGNQPIHTTRAAKSVTVTNTSPKVVAITSIALTGTDAGQFASTNNCGSSLAGHATCTIKVTFKPSVKGVKSATLNVNGGGGGLRSVKLKGTGT